MPVGTAPARSLAENLRAPTGTPILGTIVRQLFRRKSMRCRTIKTTLSARNGRRGQPPLDNGLALGAAIVAESIGSLRDKNEFPSLMTILHRKVLRYLLRISANDGLYILPKELAGCEGRLFLRQPVQKRTRKYRMTVATAVCDRFIRAATQEVTRLSKIYLVKELDTAHSDRGRLGSPMTE